MDHHCPLLSKCVGVDNLKVPVMKKNLKTANPQVFMQSSFYAQLYGGHFMWLAQDYVFGENMLCVDSA